MSHGVFAIFGPLTQASEPLIDEYMRLYQIPFITIDEAYANRQHAYKLRLLPDVAPALSFLLNTHLNWSVAYYIYSSRDGRSSILSVRLLNKSTVYGYTNIDVWTINFQ